MEMIEKRIIDNICKMDEEERIMEELIMNSQIKPKIH